MTNKNEWNGEGFPEPNTHVEYYNPIPKMWREIIITAYGKQFMIAEDVLLGSECVLSKLVKLRPLKTQTQSEREEAIEVMKSHSAVTGGAYLSKLCESLYDAGYRKQGKVVDAKEVEEILYSELKLHPTVIVEYLLKHFTITRKVK